MFAVGLWVGWICVCFSINLAVEDAPQKLDTQHTFGLKSELQVLD